jgi:hypothetical protein
VNNKILRNYVSALDLFLNRFDKEHPKWTQSQQKEVDKYKRIYYLRDVDNRQEPEKKLWDEF